MFLIYAYPAYALTVFNSAYWLLAVFAGNNSYTPYHATPRHGPVTYLSLRYSFGHQRRYTKRLTII